VFALSGMLLLLSGDARVLIVKDAVWPLAAGVVAGGSCLRGKPVTFFMLRPLLTQGRPENRPFWDQVWAGGSAFRRCLRTLAIGWSVILLGGTALYGRRTGLGVRRSLEAMNLPAGGAR
jgi:hypothetical protein